MERIVEINLADHSYRVHIGSGLLRGLGDVVAGLGEFSSAVVVTESNVGPLHGQVAINGLGSAGVPVSEIGFAAGEENKNLKTFGELFDQLYFARPAVDRKSIIVGLGGGVATDIAGFVAATALRGLSWIACPTSLLAAVDASVGGKTGVDHTAGKNLIGAFHQPAAVVIDVETLRTLPRREMINGLAECVKHGVIADESLLDFIDKHAERLLPADTGEFDAELMCELIARNVEIKARVVEADATEQGIRAKLNFGHTVGHAIESYIGYDKIRHGEAISLGMVAANAIAVARGLITPEYAARIRNLLEKLGLPVKVARGMLDFDAIWRIMQHDKKSLAGRVRTILPTAPGTAEIFDDVEPNQIHSAIQELEN